MHTAPSPAVHLAAVCKTYGTAEAGLAALSEVSLSLPRGSFTAIMGPSGSGKSTLLQCAAGLDTPTSGEIHIDGQPFPTTGEQDLTVFRRDRIAFVFQQYNLLGYITVLDNVLLPQRLAGRPVDDNAARVLLAQVGLEHLADRLPAALSGGQQQRVAIARALLGRPSVLFADEPTGALDSSSGRAVLALLRKACDVHRRTVVMVTHDPVAAACADAVVFLTDGRVVDLLTRPDAAAVAQRMTRSSDTRIGGGVT